MNGISLYRKTECVSQNRPVPRTLSNILKRLSQKPRESNAPELMSPEELLQQRAPMLDPEVLFRGVSVRPSLDAQTRQQIAEEGMKTPDMLFGDRKMALPGHHLASPQELDILPGQALPEIILQPLPQSDKVMSKEEIAACLFPETESQVPCTGPLPRAVEQRALRTGPLPRAIEQKAPRTGPLLPRPASEQNNSDPL